MKNSEFEILISLIDNGLIAIRSAISLMKGSNNIPTAIKDEFENYTASKLEQIIYLLSALKNINPKNIATHDIISLKELLASEFFHNLSSLINAFESEYKNNRSPKSVDLDTHLSKCIDDFLHTSHYRRDNSVWRGTFLGTFNKLIALEYSDIDKINELRKLSDDVEIARKSVEERALEFLKISGDAKSSMERMSEEVKGFVANFTARVDGDKFRRESYYNLGGLIAVVILIAVLFAIEYLYVIAPLKELYYVVIGMSDNQFYFSLLKVFFFGSFSIALFVVLLKALLVFLHNFLINREKSAALYTYDKFFQNGGNPVATTAATIELIRTVLGARDTGLSAGQTDKSGSDDYVQAIKSLVEVMKSQK